MVFGEDFNGDAFAGGEVSAVVDFGESAFAEKTSELVPAQYEFACGSFLIAAVSIRAAAAGGGVFLELAHFLEWNWGVLGGGGGGGFGLLRMGGY